MFLAGDEIAQVWNKAAQSKIEFLGSRYCRKVGFRDAWAFITIKGRSDYKFERFARMGYRQVAYVDNL